jgi:peptidoglycan lytic transglycosylase
MLTAACYNTRGARMQGFISHSLRAFAGRRAVASPQWRFGMGLLLLLLTASCGVQEQAVSPEQISELFNSLRSGQVPAHLEPLVSGARKANRADPDWPTVMYLLGEINLRRGATTRARETFRELASWAATDQAGGPYGDARGGSGLAAVGLWRWLKLLEQDGGTSEEVGQVLNVASALQRSFLFAGVVRGGALLPALPLMEEDIARSLAHIAWNNRLTGPAIELFLEFLSIDSSGKFDALDEQIMKKILDDGIATPQRLDLFMLRRRLSLVKTQEQKDQAAEALKRLWENARAPADVRAEAGYEWANYHRRAARVKGAEIISVLNSVLALAGGRGPIAEKALYRRALTYYSGKQPEAFVADVQKLVHEFPKGRLANDARFQLASAYLYGAESQLNTALGYFEELRSIEESNDRLDSSYFFPALGLMARAKGDDLDAADRLLADYLERYPNGPLRFRCLFWRGRVAERRGDAAGAARWFEQVTKEAPYNFYGVRARMHLREGAEAAAKAIPGAASKDFNELPTKYRAHGPDVELARKSPYHERVRRAAGNGLYTALLEINTELSKKFGSRLDNITLEALDSTGYIPAVALLLSLRQDAVVARDTALTADNRLRLAGLLGHKIHDWPVAILVMSVGGQEPPRHTSDLQNDARYLATKYPSVDMLGGLKRPLAEAAWQIDGSLSLSQSLMYVVARHESYYFPAAISPAGALGLFQVLPKTFRDVKPCRDPSSSGDAASAPVYLLDPDRNIRFWSCWVRLEFAPETRDGIAMTVVKHQAGAGNLGRFMPFWKQRGAEKDLEFQVETLRLPATSSFVRQVLADVAIVDAIGLFGASAEIRGGAKHE